MKLLILTCLVAVALARPKFPLRQLELFQNQVDSSEPTPELREEYVNELNRQRELLREKQSDEIKVTRDEFTQDQVMADAEQRECSSSSSNEEQLLRLIKHSQPQLDMAQTQEQIRRMNVHNQIPEPFQQFYQLSAYPSAAWYYPPQMQYVPLLPFFHIFRPTASENAEKTVMPVW
uniref:Alpha-S1-casein n=1 Tax=Sciurus vulgaris TaxID=55149 RepID=A0A8D2DRN1_SCIVU